MIFNQIIIKISLCVTIYSFQIFEWLYLIFFIVGMFAAFFKKSGKEILMEKVEEKWVELEEEKKKMAKLEKEKKEEEKKLNKWIFN